MHSKGDGICKSRPVFAQNIKFLEINMLGIAQVAQHHTGINKVNQA